MGTDEQWERPRRRCARRSTRQGRAYEVSPGEGTFYGPKIDFHVTDALGRSWQLGTCQLDFQMPERFELGYPGEDNAEHRPVMIHRALLGSMERFAGSSSSTTAAGSRPGSRPVQAAVLPVSDTYLDYAARLPAQLARGRPAGRVDDRSESVGRKIRDAELAKLPFMVVVGEREEADGASLRSHERGDLGAPRRRDGSTPEAAVAGGRDQGQG